MKKKLIALCVVEFAVIVLLITILAVVNSTKHAARKGQETISAGNAESQSSDNVQSVSAQKITDEELDALKKKYGSSINYVSTDKDGNYVINAGFRQPYVGSFDFLVKDDGNLTDNYCDMLYQKLVDSYVDESNYSVYSEWEEDEKLSFDRPMRIFDCYDRSSMSIVSKEMADMYEYLTENSFIKEHEADIPAWYIRVAGTEDNNDQNAFPYAVMDGSAYDRAFYMESVYGMMDRAFSKAAAGSEGEYSDVSGDSVSDDTDSNIDRSYYTDDVVKNLWTSFGEQGTGLSSTTADGTEYRMIETDAAMGSRLYIMLASKDNGKTVDIVNYDPLNNTGGVAYYLKMFDDGTGYISQVWNGGDDGDLFRTDNYGKHFKLSDLPSPDTKLDDGTPYNPFTIPQMPDKDGNDLTLVVKQSEYAGDYKGGTVSGRYESDDNGETWKYAGETE